MGVIFWELKRVLLEFKINLGKIILDLWSLLRQ